MGWREWCRPATGGSVDLVPVCAVEPGYGANGDLRLAFGGALHPFAGLHAEHVFEDQDETVGLLLEISVVEGRDMNGDVRREADVEGIFPLVKL